MQEAQENLAVSLPNANNNAQNTMSQAMSDVEARLAHVIEAAGPAGEAIFHLVGSGGKRVRPSFTLMIAATCADFTGEFPIEFAVAGELIHTASLLHDDVIDEGILRRGKDTPRVVWSNTVSVLAGDHCLASAVDLIRRTEPGATLQEALETVQNLVNGELLQLQSKDTLNLDEAHYRRICELKTASLFTWCARAGARFANASEHQLNAVGRMAHDVGFAFQIQDDLLDMTGDVKFGKRLLDDLREGRMTLPVIRAVVCDRTIGERLHRLYASDRDPSDEELIEVQERVVATDAIASVRREVAQLTMQGIEHLHALPKTPYRDLIEAQIVALGARPT